jgi:hypothetical protein
MVVFLTALSTYCFLIFSKSAMTSLQSEVLSAKRFVSFVDVLSIRGFSAFGFTSSSSFPMADFFLQRQLQVPFVLTGLRKWGDIILVFLDFPLDGRQMCLLLIHY